MTQYCQAASKSVQYCTTKLVRDEYDPKGRILMPDQCWPKMVTHYVCVEDQRKSGETDGGHMNRLQRQWNKAVEIWKSSPTDGSVREYDATCVVSYKVEGEHVLKNSAATYLRNGNECGFFGFITGYCTPW